MLGETSNYQAKMPTNWSLEFEMSGQWLTIVKCNGLYLIHSFIIMLRHHYKRQRTLSLYLLPTSREHVDFKKLKSKSIDVPWCHSYRYCTDVIVESSASLDIVQTQCNSHRCQRSRPILENEICGNKIQVGK